MKRFVKKGFAILLASTLILGLNAASFAAWPGFQDGNPNNGVIPSDTAVPPPLEQPTPTSVPLPQNNTVGDVFTGIDAASVINNGVAYTLYNGGDVTSSGTTGGARVQATVIDPTVLGLDFEPGEELWNEEIVAPADNNPATVADLRADNINQLSTPFYNVDTNTLYTGVSTSEEFFAVENLLNTAANTFTTTGAVMIDQTTGVATFTGNGTITTTINVPVEVALLSTVTNMITNNEDSTGTYNITLTNESTLNSVSVVGSPGDNPPLLTTFGTTDTFDGAALAAGTYTLKVFVMGLDTAVNEDVTLSTISLAEFDWTVFAVSDANTEAPDITVLTSGEGQINTPIVSDGLGNIYWGLFGGDHGYFQFDTTSAASDTNPLVFRPEINDLINFPSGFDDFDNAGAVIVGGNVYFGSDSGRVYAANVMDFATVSGELFDVNDHVDANGDGGGSIRSTMVSDGSGMIYFTSQGVLEGNLTTGAIWRFTPVGAAPVTPDAPVVLPGNSVSTPVISDNEQVYVGILGESVGVQAVSVSNFATVNLVSVFAGDAVDSSPIVFTDADNTGNDFIFFTTNSENGAGMAFSFNGTAGAFAWEVPNNAINQTQSTLDNPFSAQGMAFDDGTGTLVWGDDGANLYIAPAPPVVSD